jgi:transposase
MKRQDLTHAERVVIVERHIGGGTLRAIAESLNLNLYTVRHWWRVYRDGGWAALTPAAKGPGRRGTTEYGPVVLLAPVWLSLADASAVADPQT